MNSKLFHESLNLMNIILGVSIFLRCLFMETGVGSAIKGVVFIFATLLNIYFYKKSKSEVVK